MTDELSLRVDITASLLFTRKPQYPLPSSLIPHCALPIPHDILTPALQALAKEAQIAEDIYTIEILTCLQSLYAIASYIESDIAVNHHAPWQDEESIGLRLNPLAHRLLSLPPLSGSSSAFRGNHTATALQLGQIIWIIWVKRRYRAYPGSPAGYASKLLGLMMVDELGGGQELEFLPVRLWLLVLCAVSCSEREKGVAVGMIGDVMSRWGLNSWSAVMSHVTQMPWVSMLDALCTDIERSCIITSHS
ncbi:hypothetical protein BJY04DRAFT_6381 [Aspergillus karnatakaensis]|uniref:uncharacterized protein n=1 Tax=Aspergillus karnatakaensis TaxID=1810916 RepID=UPI003CCDABB2